MKLTLELLSNLSRKANSRSLTDADKVFISDLSAQWKMPFNKNTRCKMCWIDQTMLLVIHAKKIIRKYGTLEIENK